MTENITREQADEIAKKAVEGVLERLGVDTKNPLQAQADFQKLRALRKMMEDEEFILDLQFMRRWRRNTDKVTDTGLKTFIRWLVVGSLGIFLLGTKDWWIKHITG